MTPWIYDDTATPRARWGMANGEPSVHLDMPDGSGDEGDDAGTDQWDGETAIFQGGKALAIRWLEAALEQVKALPEEPTWPGGEKIQGR